MIVPGLAIFITVLAFNLLGDGLRDALDPRSTLMTLDRAASQTRAPSVLADVTGTIGCDRGAHRITEGVDAALMRRQSKPRPWSSSVAAAGRSC